MPDDGDRRDGQGEPAREGGANRALAAVYLVAFVNVVSFGIVIPLLPFYAERFGAPAFVVGLLFATYAGAQFLGVPVLGYLSDRYGRRPVLVASLLGSALSFVLLAVAQGLALLFVARLIDGATGGNITTARAVVADVTSEEDRARAYGRLGAAFGIGFFVGPALGGVLAGVDFRLPAWVAMALALLSAALTWVWLPETAPAGAEPRGWPWQEARRLLVQPVVAKLSTVDLVWWSAFGAYQTTFPLFVAERLGYGATGSGVLLGYFGVVFAAVQFLLVGRVVDRLGERNALVAGIALGALGIGGAALAPELVTVVLALTPAAAGIGLSVSALRSLLSRVASPEEQGRLQGVSGSVESLGRGIGPLWGNGLLGLAGAGVAYGSVATVLCALSAWSTRLPDLRAGSGDGADTRTGDTEKAPDHPTAKVAGDGS